MPMIGLPAEFKPSHRHVRSGNLYEKLLPATMKVGDDQESWTEAVIYRNSQNHLFVRPWVDFERKFVAL